MDWGKVGRWLLLAGSLVLGIIAGLTGYWIFQAKVPAAMQTTMLAAEARTYYIVTGVVLGFIIFGWSMVGVKIAGRAAASQARREVETK